MKVQQLYQELKDLADKLDVTVSEQNFRNTGVRVQSGFCKIKNKNHCIIDKHLRLSRKIDALAECLSLLPHESVFIRPVVRELLEQVTGKASNV